MSATLPRSPLPATGTASVEASPMRQDYQLRDALLAQHGRVLLSGTQALVRLLLMQRASDAERGLDTRGFVSGYRGSPLGMVDQELWRARPELDAAGVRFVPAVNEELAATQVLGTQRVAQLVVLAQRRGVIGRAGAGGGFGRGGGGQDRGHGGVLGVGCRTIILHIRKKFPESSWKTGKMEMIFREIGYERGNPA